MSIGTNTGKLVRRKLAFERNFTQLPNEWLRDERLSYRARGILAMLMSHEPGWSVTIKALAATSTDGKAAIATALSELKEFGYLTMRKVRSAKGYIVGVNWEIFDPSRPVDDPTLPGLESENAPRPIGENPRSALGTDYPAPGNPAPGNPAPGNPAPGNPAPGNPAPGNRTLKEDQSQEELTNQGSTDVTTEGPVDKSPAERYSEAIRARCTMRHGQRHRYEASGYCADCGARMPAVELVDA